MYANEPIEFFHPSSDAAQWYDNAFSKSPPLFSNQNPSKNIASGLF
jgi:hypothetical protein